jgi:acetyl esterase/lipase
LPLVVVIPATPWGASPGEPGDALRFVERRYALAVISCRPPEEAPFPGQVHDCKAAIRWLRANGACYGIDPDHIGVWGISTGGYLATLLGVTANDLVLEGSLGDHPDRPSDVQAVCDWFGPVDLTAFLPPAGILPADAAHKEGPEPQPSRGRGRALAPVAIREALAVSARSLMAGSETGSLLAFHANPVNLVTPDDAPTLIMHGEQDRVVPLSHSVALHEAMVGAGVQSGLRMVPGAGHGLADTDLVNEVIDFFDRHLRPLPLTQVELQ